MASPCRRRRRNECNGTQQMSFQQHAARTGMNRRRNQQQEKRVLFADTLLLGVSLIALASNFTLQATAFVAPNSVTAFTCSVSTVRETGGWAIQGIARRERASRSMVLMSERRGLWPTRSTIDLRSDTVTHPTAGMRKAMHKDVHVCGVPSAVGHHRRATRPRLLSRSTPSCDMFRAAKSALSVSLRPAAAAASTRAEVGDDVLGEDPTVKKLEAETAEILGKEAALFVPSGTMANLICHLVWCSQRGSEMILGDQSHSFLWEQAGAAQFGGIGYRPLKNLPDGTIDLNHIEAAVRGNNPCFPVSRLVSIENTHAQCGGKVLPIGYLDDLATLAQEEGLRVHMDGARLWNAAAASRLSPARIVASVDSVAVCYSKGLGAPVGSAVVGSADFISRAHRVRKALGGGMRQSGIVAAAALEGLRKQLPRLGDDHTNAKKLAQGFHDLGVPNALKADPSSVQSNIVLVEVGPDLTDSDAGMSAPLVCDRLREKGVLAMSLMPRVIRFITHCQVSTQDIQRTVAMMKEVLEEAGVQDVGLRRPAAVEERSESTEPGGAPSSDQTASSAASGINHIDLNIFGEALGAAREFADSLNGDGDPASGPASVVVGISRDGGGKDADPDPLLSKTSAVYDEDLDVDGREGQAEGEGAEEEEEPSPYLHSFEEVQLQGMTVSNEGFVAVMTSKESGRALRLIMTPDDPMSGGLDVEEAETSEARTLLQLMQGIDVARHLPSDALGSLMGVPMSSGVQLSTVCVVDARPFSATLTAKIPHRDGETGLPSSSTSFPYSAPTEPAPTSRLPAAGHNDGANGSGGAGGGAGSGQIATEQGGIVSVVGGSLTGGGVAGKGTGGQASGGHKEGSPQAAVGRPRLGVSKEAVSRSSFETFALALRYPTSKIYVRTELLAPGDGDEDAAMSFDATEVPDLYPGLVKLVDAKSRRSAADEMDAQFEAARIRQQLESAMNSGDADRINLLREQLNKLLVTDVDTANV